MNPPQGPSKDTSSGFDELELRLSTDFTTVYGHSYSFARQLALDIRLSLEVHTPQMIVVTGIGGQ